MTLAPHPVTGAWQVGDPAGARRFASVGDVALERGGVVPDVVLAYETWGEPTGDNAVLVLHALTGDSHVAGPAGEGHPTPGWWDALVGPGKAVDTDRFFVVAANMLGGCQGSTGPATRRADGRAWGSDFPFLTIRDQVRAEIQLADALGIDRWHTIMGGSAGGMRALEWAIMQPDRVQRLFLLATSAYASAEQVAYGAIQNDVIRADPAWRGGDYYDAKVGPTTGLDLARRLAHLSYRSETELAVRFGRDVQDDGRFAVESYLQHHGAKLTGRFDANSYLVIAEAMNSHDVGRGRGGIAEALGRITAETVVAGIDSDRLYPLHQQQELAEGVPGAGDLDVVHSDHGHDGFLIEAGPIGDLARDLLLR